MSVFLLKRLATFIATLAVASLLVFGVLELLPGNVAQVILGDSATAESLAALEKKLGLDRPAATRYLAWVGGLAQGRTALSQSYDVPTGELIAERLQVSLPLAAMAMGITVVLALALGIYAAARHNRIGDVSVMDALLRAQLKAATPKADAMQILYGGSMKPDNAASLLAQPDIDGGLIGGAALKAADFVAICRAAG